MKHHPFQYTYRSNGVVKVIIDAADYFADLTETMLSAKYRVDILGWDINSETMLIPSSHPLGPMRLRDLLEQSLEANPDLVIRILCWDFPPLYIMEREAFLPWKLDRADERLLFEFDDQHPIGASQHQKIVLIDDHCAYTGGIDLTVSRWDSSDHEPHHPLRTLPSGTPYAPFHDVQAKVQGDVVKDIADLVTQRMKPFPRMVKAGQTISAAQVRAARSDALVPLVTSSNSSDDLIFQNAAVYLCLTQASLERKHERRDVEDSYLKLIQKARNYVYFENQYLSSQSVCQALIESLSTSEGPEIVIVLPKKTGGWLEESTMGRLQDHWLRLLLKSDQYDRLVVYYPDDQRLTGETYKTVHSKVMIVDDQWLRIGSANLNNRSMGLD